VCVHGLSRNGGDFDYLANSFVQDDRFGNLQVVCPDVVGRGQSDWLEVKQDYSYNLYSSNIATLLSVVNRGEKLDFIGTSMGGLIGMMLAAQPNCPIRKLVLNDIGPFIPKEALEFIASYFGKRTEPFQNFGEALTYFKKVHNSFGLTEEDEWVTFTKSSVKEENGKFHLLYDTNIAAAHFKPNEPCNDIALWVLWDQIKCPVMLIRGKESILLTSNTVDEMRKRGPGLAAFLEVDGVGHAPSLQTPEQVDPIKEFLLKD